MMTEELASASSSGPGAVARSTRAGMGSIPYATGTTFRVWAPFASSVSVAGTFNDWSEDSHELAPEGDGYWSADIEGVGIGAEYKYVIGNGDRTFWRIDPYAKHVTSSVGNAVVVDSEFDWGDEPFRAPPWNELVIYELHVGTFYDQPGGPPGNISGILQKLQHLSALGVNAIQIMPPFEFAGGFSWGYNPAHIFAIEQDYGGPLSLKLLIRTAHERGIAVIFDVVYNHLGPSDLDLWRFDGWFENDKGGVYFYNDWRADTPWGPRPDYGRPEVRRFLRDNALMWLEEYRADGLRWDATAYIRNTWGNNDDPAGDIPDGWELMRWINGETDSRQPWKISIAEDLRGNAWITKNAGDGGAGFDAQWDGRFVHPVRAAMTAPSDEWRRVWDVRDAILSRYNPDAFERVIYTESHDEVANGKARLPQEISPGAPASYDARKRSTLGAALVFTTPGIPMIFQGQELLEDEWFRDTDPIDWSKKETFAGIFLLYRDLVRLRRNWYDTTRGLKGQHVNVHHVNDRDKVLAFHRWEHGGPRDDVVIVVNLSRRSFDHYTLGFPRPGEWKVRLNSDWTGYSSDFGAQSSFDTVAYAGWRDGMAYHASIGIGPYTAVILSQD